MFVKLVFPLHHCRDQVSENVFLHISFCPCLRKLTDFLLAHQKYCTAVLQLGGTIWNVFSLSYAQLVKYAFKNKARLFRTGYIGTWEGLFSSCFIFSLRVVICAGKIERHTLRKDTVHTVQDYSKVPHKAEFSKNVLISCCKRIQIKHMAFYFIRFYCYGLLI